LHNLEFGERVESRGVLDITSGDLEAGAVPWASDTSVAGDDTLDLMKEIRSDKIHKSAEKRHTIGAP
jgi:hypothetical protein